MKQLNIKSLFSGFKSPEIISLFVVLTLILTVGTVFYKLVEKWSWVDAFYFSGMTLTTVGYGDLTPQSDLSKVFTIFYVLTGLGIVLAFVQSIAKQQTQKSWISKVFGINKQKR